MEIVGKDIIGSRNGTGEGPAEATHLLCLRNRKEARSREPGKGLRAERG